MSQSRNRFLNEELAANLALSLLDLFPAARADFAARAVQQAFAWGERCLDLFERQHPLPQPVACQAGCAYCCYNQIELTVPEALFLGAEVSRQLSSPALAALLERAEQSLALRAGKSKEAVARLRPWLPCPLLQDRRCLAYEARPLLCRAMHSLAVQDCVAELAHPEQPRVKFYPHRQAIYFSLSQGLLTACRSLGLQGGPVDLAQGLRDYFGQEQPQAAWLAGKTVFATASTTS